MSQPSAQRVVSLYRQILKQGKSWQGPKEEQTYIIEEARRLFRLNQEEQDRAQIDQQIREGELRLQYARQYQIPYPRLHHKSQHHYIEPPQMEDHTPAAGDPDINAKLKAAMERRRQKQQHTVHDSGG
jgi:hypothetical protein